MRRRHRAAHFRIWIVLSVLLPLLLIGALAARRNGPIEAAPISLSEAPS
jgi:hypothetical protein